MKSKLLNSIILAGVTVLFAAGCNQNQVAPPANEVEVSSAPPPVQVEVEPPAPGPDFVWVGGVWVWGPGDRWVWQGGRWDHPPRAGAVWAPHHYEFRDGHHVFVRGGWR